MTIEISLKLDYILKKRGMTQKELSRITGIRHASISEMSRNIKTDINKKHLSLIMEKLEIYNISEIIEVKKVD